jgi:hypothetical protein
MKPATSALRAILSFLFVILILTACKETPTGKIPFDEAKAREQIISISQGSKYSQNFVSLRDSVLPRVINDSSFLEKRFSLPIAETFNRDAIIALLNADGAQGVRVYFGNDEKGLVRLVLMPVDKDGKDIITQLTGKTPDRAAAQTSQTRSTATGESVENGQRPPPPYSALGTGN